MTKLLEQAIAKVRELPEEEQDAIAIVLFSMADASAFPIDDETRQAILEGLAQAERREFVADDIVSRANKRHGI
jgi:hypothetical protein